MRFLSQSFDTCLLWLIGVYQRRISPRKGWRCAHARLHGGPGCSGFARETIQMHGSFAALPAVRGRFRDCKSAAQVLRAGQNALVAPPDDERNSRRNSSGGACVPDLNYLCCAESVADAAPGLLGACDAGACHVGACECFACF